jgi:hypothetical protein
MPTERADRFFEGAKGDVLYGSFHSRDRSLTGSHLAPELTLREPTMATQMYKTFGNAGHDVVVDGKAYVRPARKIRE